MNVELILSQTLDAYLLWTNPYRKFLKFDGKVLKFMSEINEGVGGTSAKLHNMQGKHRSPFQDAL